MKKTIFTFLTLAFLGLSTTYGQVGIGTVEPHESAILDVKSEVKGLLPPRMTEVQMEDINNAAEGLIVYCIDCEPKGLYNYDGAAWVPLGASTGGNINLDCSADGFTGADFYKDAPVVGQTFSITLTNESFSEVSLTFNASDIELTGVSGLSISNVSPESETLAGGDNVQVTYTLDGTPTEDGILTANVDIAGLGILECTRTVVVGELDSGEVQSLTGKVWMDKNLGATTVATSPTDAQAYGDLYQWGRAAEGHQLRSLTCPTGCYDVELNGAGVANFNDDPADPWHGKFILRDNGDNNWVIPTVSGVDDLWQGVNGTNNPCPSGYRVPTEAEWQDELDTWANTTNRLDDAVNSPLALPAAGYRARASGSLRNVGSDGFYWSSTVSGTGARDLRFDSSAADMNALNRANGGSVRCLKD